MMLPLEKLQRISPTIVGYEKKSLYTLVPMHTANISVIFSSLHTIEYSISLKNPRSKLILVSATTQLVALKLVTTSQSFLDVNQYYY